MVDLAGGNLFVLLLLMAVASIILGMGMPTVSAYVILSILGVPALTDLGVNLIAAHMFVFYFGVLSGLTPPVAITAYTTAGIAGSNPNGTALYAMRIGFGGFFLPFIFVYNPQLLMQGGNTLEITLVTVSALISCFLLAASIEGYFIQLLSVIQRILLFVGAVGLVVPGIAGDLFGIAALIIVFLWQKSKNNNVPKQLSA